MSLKAYLPKFIDLEAYNELSNQNKKYIMKAEKGHEDSIIYVSSSFLLGKNDFPKNKDIGIKYLIYGTELNLPKVMEQYGTHLLLGEVIPKNEEEGIKLLNKVATIQKDANKKLFLVEHILSKESYDIDSTSNCFINYVLAKQILKEAADLGNARAMVEYGRICRKSKKNKYGEIIPDYIEASKYFKMSSKKGDPVGMEFLGTMLENGEGGEEKNPKEAQKLFKAAYEKGNLDACALYGYTLTQEGYGYLNEAEGLRLIKYALDNGSSVGMCSFGIFYYHGFCGFEENNEKAIKYYRMAIENKNASALFNMGQVYKDGIAVEKDMKTAIKYYTLAFENGNVLAAGNLGDAYSNKDLKEFYDLTKAQKYYKIAVDYGLMQYLSDYCIALANDNKNIEKNKKELKKYLEIGIDKKDCETMCIYACILFDGDKLPINEYRSVSLFKECAKMGDKYAIKQLIEIYDEGQGSIMQDHEEAQKYRNMLEMEQKAVESKCCLLI